MSKNSIYLQSTEVPVQKSSAEIQQILVKAGARQIAMDYQSDGSIKGMRFALGDGQAQTAYELPVRTTKLFERLQAKRPPYQRVKYKDVDASQAERIAWRQLVMWIKAQVALMDIGMTTSGEVFFPYQLAPGSPTHQTIYEFFQQNGQKLLTAPEEK